jgi:hypothetical protein
MSMKFAEIRCLLGKNPYRPGGDCGKTGIAAYEKGDSPKRRRSKKRYFQTRTAA